MNKSPQTQARLRRVALPLVVALALSTSLSACGKKGDLAPPPAHDSTTD
jgi:predicted small lipoprotein YifL